METRNGVTALERTARELGVELHPVEVHGPDDIERALSAIAHGQAEALVASDAARLGLHAKRIGDFVVEHRLPTIGASRQPSYLMAYWVRSDLLWRRAAVFIDKILKGARPGDLPMERAYKFVLVINLKIAQGARDHDAAIAARPSGRGDPIGRRRGTERSSRMGSREHNYGVRSEVWRRPSLTRHWSRSRSALYFLKTLIRLLWSCLGGVGKAMCI